MAKVLYFQKTYRTEIFEECLQRRGMPHELIFPDTWKEFYDMADGDDIDMVIYDQSFNEDEEQETIHELATKTNKPLILCLGNITRRAIKNEYFDRNISLLPHPVCASVLLDEIDKRLVSEHGGLYEDNQTFKRLNEERQEEERRHNEYMANQALYNSRHINSDMLWAELFEFYD